jgi:D-beta-D-heptose 7-phosphate kinase/D-beta-D-heptose 1-phosphate adenosyltransferase
MREIINQLKIGKKKEVLVIGEIMLDEYLIGNAERISSEAPIPVIKELSYEYCIGGAGNAAANCFEVGLKTTVVSIIGDSDFAGQKLVALFKDMKMSISGLIKSKERKTTYKKRIISKNQQLLCIDIEDVNPLSKNEFKLICDKIDQQLKPEMVVLISDYDRGLVTPELVSYVIKKASALNCLIMADPSGPNYEKYRGVHYIKPNLKEINEMVHCFNLNKDADLLKNGLAICKLLECKGLFVTLGEKGIQFVSPEKQVFSPTLAKEIYGLAGAGDTVFAYLTLGMSCNLPIETCLKLANKAAAVAVSHVKTYTVGLDELIDKEIEFSEKIYTEWSHVKIELDWQSLGNKKVVFTNGCFDILHAGHIHLLKDAKKMGDFLIVGLNSDESIKKLGKGQDRPINSFADRAIVIAALGMVDFVVEFNHSSPKELLEYLKPDIFVKGGDYAPEKVQDSELFRNFIDESEVVKKYGGVVKAVSLIAGLSTTNILKKINGNQI